MAYPMYGGVRKSHPEKYRELYTFIYIFIYEVFHNNMFFFGHDDSKRN